MEINDRINLTQSEYDRLAEYCSARGMTGNFVSQTDYWRQGVWRDTLTIIESFGVDIEGKATMDVGCKYGHLFPLLVALGAARVVGVEVVREYIDAGSEVFGRFYPNTQIVESDRGYVPVPSKSMDIVFLFEVISHVNPGYFDAMLAEMARVLKPGGNLLISDGNNTACPGYFEENLTPLYEAWENGPDGLNTGRDTVTRPFVVRRADIIRERHPKLPESQVDYLARNTSGLFGSFLEKTIDDYAETGTLVERPYLKGMCPVNPSCEGTVMERGFHPEFIKRALEGYGFEVVDTGLAGVAKADRPGGWLARILGRARDPKTGSAPAYPTPTLHIAAVRK